MNNSFAALEDRALVLKDRVDVLSKNLADRTPPIPDFDQVVAHIEKRDGCAGTEAFTKARREAPQAFAVFNRLNPKKPTTDADEDELKDVVAPAARKSAPAADFMREVDNVMIEKSCSRTQAMTAARRREPELFRQFQEFEVR